MLTSIKILETGPIRGMKRAFGRVKKDAFAVTADKFHKTNTAKRFTAEHAAKAGYAARKGQLLSPHSKAFARSYYGRKLRSRFGGGVGQALPLVYSGTTRARARTPRLEANSKGATLRFNTPALNFKHPKSRVNMRDEFTRILPEEQRGAVAEMRRQLAARIRRLRKA